MIHISKNDKQRAGMQSPGETAEVKSRAASMPKPYAALTAANTISRALDVAKKSTDPDATLLLVELADRLAVYVGLENFSASPERAEMDGVVSEAAKALFQSPISDSFSAHAHHLAQQQHMLETQRRMYEYERARAMQNAFPPITTPKGYLP